MPLRRFSSPSGFVERNGRGAMVRLVDILPAIELVKEIDRIRRLSADYEPSDGECLKLDELLGKCQHLIGE